MSSLRMISEGIIGYSEQLKQPEHKYAYYFGGVMMSSAHLAPIRQTMVEMYGKDNVTILASALSKDFPQPRKHQFASEIEEKLRKGEQVKLICHSLGTVEAMRVLRAVDQHILEQNRGNISIDLISPAGLFSDARGMAVFMRRFVDNSVLREKFKPSLRRGIESLAIYPPEIDGFSEVMQLLFPDWKPAKVQGIPEQIAALLHLHPEKLADLRYADEFVNDAIGLQDRGLLEEALIMRGRILMPSIMKFHQESVRRDKKQPTENQRLHFSHFTEAGKIIIRLLTGKTNETLHKLHEDGVVVRILYLAKDPIVLKHDIMIFYHSDNWEELIVSGKVIAAGDLGHSSHVILPDVLKLLEEPIPSP